MARNARGPGRRKNKQAAPASSEDDDRCAEEPDAEALAEQEAEELAALQEADPLPTTKPKARRPPRPCRLYKAAAREFVGDPVPDHDARRAWPSRYLQRPAAAPKKKRWKDAGDEYVGARRHYRAAKVEGTIYNIGDDVYIRAEDGQPHLIGRITEFFEGTELGHYFSGRSFFRPQDTVISAAKLVADHNHDPKRVFLSDETIDCPIDSILCKVTILQVDPKLDLEAKAQLAAESELYYDMSYSAAYSTFTNITSDTNESSGISSDADSEAGPSVTTATLLDLYSGCGGMSTGLCLGGELAGLKLQARWAVDFNSYACKSLKYNHPQTEVWNEKADDFLSLIKEWALLCDQHVYNNYVDTPTPTDDEGEYDELEKDEFVVKKLTHICFGGTGRKECIYFKGYGPEEDTWEPIENLRDCPLKIREFVQEGYRRNILPLPGNVDVLCGGPPCQGISGFNRHRNSQEPLQDEKNRQIVTFMDIVAYLRPKYVLMENVLDILKFADGVLGKYAISRLIALNYQSRLGIMVAGGYGLPQVRMRAFLWGALPTMVLLKYALPTHEVLVRGQAPTAFAKNIVTYKETQKKTLQKALVLKDAISDLPPVGNDDDADVIEYHEKPQMTDFQRYIRRTRQEMLDYSFVDEAGPGRIPCEKGANFRDLEGVRVGPGNVVEFDPDIPRVYLGPDKPLVPDYAMKFVGGRSLKPFGRLWWDETVSTVVMRAEPHNQAVLHPKQARVLSVRENARLQGFPDYYRMDGPIKQRYMQVGNAVAVPVARALGYSLEKAYLRKHADDDPLLVLPNNFFSPDQTEAGASSSVGSPAGEVQEE
ncbi:unnamed protein product [Alopecurus aequalis]